MKIRVWIVLWTIITKARNHCQDIDNCGDEDHCQYHLGLKLGLVGSITDFVLLDVILIFTPPNNTAHQLKEGKGSVKKVRKQVTEKPFTSK